MPLLAALLAAQSPDSLYAERAVPGNAARAAEAWADISRREPANFEAAWKFARVCYFLGERAPARDQRGYIEQGIAAGERARRLMPLRPEGHFWAAANMGALAERFGMRAGLKYRKPIREALETVLRLDPSFMQGSADRALGRYYHKVPGVLGGSRTLAEQHLRASLAYDPRSTVSLYFLAELLIDARRTAEARTVLQQVLDAPLNPEWVPEDEDFKHKAAARLTSLR